VVNPANFEPKLARIAMKLTDAMRVFASLPLYRPKSGAEPPQSKGLRGGKTNISTTNRKAPNQAAVLRADSIGERTSVPG
jgi:hypothetical protein